MSNSISGRAALLAAVAIGAGAPAFAQNRSYYVDYDGGSDSANGLSPATAWKHGPGDTAGAGPARNIALKPGDRVLLKGGVRYRGTLYPKGAGTPDNPIVIDGSGWGPLRAIVDGSKPLTEIRRCRSAADCLGSPHWAKLWRGTLPAGTLWSDWLFVNDVAMQLGQYPDGLSRADGEDPEKLLPVPLSQRAEIVGGVIRHPLPPGLSTGQPVLGLWVRHNYLAFTDEITVSTSGASFAGATWIHAAFDPYTDRDSRFTILNAPAMVSKPGRFAISARDGVAIFSPPPAATALSATSAAAPRASVGAGRNGINTGRLSHAVVRGFSLSNFAARPKNYASGIAIHGNPGSVGITIADNSIRAATTMATRMGVMHFVRARDLKVERNQMVNLPNSSAMMIDMSEGPVDVSCNQISDLGRTAIRFNNVLNGKIRGNRISGVFGIHGNGISLYNDNRAILVEGNVVKEAYRPLTMHGAGSAPYFQSGDYSVVVRNNVFLGSSDVNGAVATYGNVPNLSLVDNRIAAPRYALKLSGTETGFHASGNQLVGAVAEPKGSTLFNPTLNSSFAVDGNGALLVDRWETQQVPAGICS